MNDRHEWDKKLQQVIRAYDYPGCIFLSNRNEYQCFEQCPIVQIYNKKRDALNIFHLLNKLNKIDVTDCDTIKKLIIDTTDLLVIGVICNVLTKSAYCNISANYKIINDEIKKETEMNNFFEICEKKEYTMALFKSSVRQNKIKSTDINSIKKSITKTDNLLELNVITSVLTKSAYFGIEADCETITNEINTEIQIDQFFAGFK